MLGRPRIVTEAAIQSGAERGLTAPQLAAEIGVQPQLVWCVAKRLGVRLAPSRTPRLDPKDYPRPRQWGGVFQCSDCPQMLAPGAPARCSWCVARRSLALLALADELGMMRVGGYGRLAG